GALARQPAGVRVAKLGLDLRPGLALPRTERSLPQPLVDVNVEPEPVCDDLGRLPRARQLARVDAVDAVDLLGVICRLSPAVLVEVRVRPPLPAAVAVPVGFAVADEEKRGHETARLAVPWISASGTRPASSPVRRPGSASRRRACSRPRAPA